MGVRVKWDLKSIGGSTVTYVRIIPYEEATGELKEVYDYMIESRGFIPNVQAVSNMRSRIM